jgi:hypothetical protein
MKCQDSSGVATEEATRAKYEAMTLAQLQKTCRATWLEETGSRRALVDRLTENDAPSDGWRSGSGGRYDALMMRRAHHLRATAPQ